MALILEVTEKGKTLQFELDKEKVIIGRDPSSDIKLKDDGCTHFHCSIVLRQRSLLLFDLNSKNGTFVNKVRVKEKLRIYTDDIIQIGEVYLRLVDSMMTLQEMRSFKSPQERITMSEDLTLPDIDTRNALRLKKLSSG